MKLKTCPKCKTYTMQKTHCNTPTKDTHYKFKQLPDVPTTFKHTKPNK